MTNDAQRAAIKEMIMRHTANVTKTPQAARDSLIKEGFISTGGGLTAAYSGTDKKTVNGR